MTDLEKSSSSDAFEGGALYKHEEDQLQQQRLHKNLENLTWSVMYSALVASLLAFHFGYAISAINAPSTVFSNCATLLNQNKSNSSNFMGLPGCFAVSSGVWGLVGAGLGLGGWIGSLLSGKLTSLCGLKPAIAVLNIPVIFGYLSMALAPSPAFLIIGRVLLGLAAGGTGAVVPLYLSEISPLRHRGSIMLIYQILLCFGLLVAEGVGYLGDVGRRLSLWRFTFGMNILLCVGQLIGYIWLLNPAGKNTVIDDKASDTVSTHDEDDQVGNETVLDLLLFRIKRARKSMLLGSLLHAGQQVSGVNAIFFYSVMILTAAPSTTNAPSNTLPAPSLIPLALTAVNFFMTFVSIGLLEAFGRRLVCLVSVGGSAISLLTLSLSFLISAKLLSSLSLLAFVTVFAVGLGPLPWMVTPEIFPSHWPLTPTAIAICVSLNWLSGIVVTGVFPLIREFIPMAGIFGTFGIIMLGLLISLLFLMPETKGRVAGFI